MKKVLFVLSPFILLGLASCGIPNKEPSSFNPSSNPSSSSSSSSINTGSKDSSYKDIEEKDYGDFKIETEDGDFSSKDGIFTITKAGTYECSGTLKDGNIIVDAGDDDAITLNLNDVSITSTSNSPIYIKNADEAEIHSDKDYSNTIIDNRATKTTDDENQGNGAIYSKCDLKFTGKGTLEVHGGYNNGIHTTNDLKIKNNNVIVHSVNNCLKGNDKVEIESGTFKLISSSGNGIVTEDSDVSSKGKQRGYINISGGTIDIYSAKDAIDSAYDINIAAEDESKAPTINIYTSNYSAYSKDVATSNEGVYYLKTNTKLSDSYRYSIYYTDSNSQSDFANASFFTSQNEQGGGFRGGMGSTYYYYKFSLPTNAESIQIYCFEKSASNSTETYIAKSDVKNINSFYDTASIITRNNSISISSWTTYKKGGQSGPGNIPGMSEGNNDKSEYSAKGLKADNTINIVNGKIFIKAYDDGIHANYGTELENEATGLGDVNISGGNIEIYSADDGIHADRYLSISGGDINITYSYEGIEGNVINFSGGNTLVYAKDDGVNAANKSNLNPEINVSGGKIDITVASGDTDGIDSNGTYNQTGGVVITRGSGSNMSTGLDCDKTASISAGTFISFGKTETTLKTSGNIKSQTINMTFSAKTYTFTLNEFSINTTNKTSYQNAYIYSDVGNTFTVS